MDSPILWVVIGVAVLGLIWLLFSMLATSRRSRAGEEPHRGPSGAAWPLDEPEQAPPEERDR